ncbi:MAG: alpha-ketoglutarate-dependent dioxygenase AlkB [Planctomycetaceae bacterium]|nr:alpha-ketoglutarate-dependent dioxygenase AlkB [Planctomycetaceae bacterium]
MARFQAKTHEPELELLCPSYGFAGYRFNQISTPPTTACKSKVRRIVAYVTNLMRAFLRSQNTPKARRWWPSLVLFLIILLVIIFRYTGLFVMEYQTKSKREFMSTSKPSEANILTAHNVLVACSKLEDQSLVKNFCGTVISLHEMSFPPTDFSGKTVYLCGDISVAKTIEKDLKKAARIYVIRELCDNIDNPGVWNTVDVGRVPLLVHGVGVYYRRFFDTDIDYFEQICSEHTFQSLTESTKPGTAHRTGIYLSPVNQDGEQLHFRLLRCSTNLSGPTENFRANDRHIVDALNLEAARIFQNHAPLNHVLAQVYHNTPANGDQKQTKAKIKLHSDKTKDMPENGIMAFCTFYDQLNKLQPLDEFDYGYNNTSGLTKLSFRLKPQVAERPECTLAPQFTVTLYPNSVFFIPLSTNRLYTHEIRSSALDASKLPTRLGYVVRCSATKAVHKDGQTFLDRNGTLAKLEPPTQTGMAELRALYADENKTDAFIDYGHKFNFSMNSGDYLAPDYNVADEFRSYDMNLPDNLFNELFASVQFEDLGKGRQGTVLLKPDPSRGTPLVRTTSKFKTPPQCFQPIHLRLAKEIQKRVSLPLAFNNALIENYTNAYATMGYHSDQALDLENDSYIAVYSCYKYSDQVNPPRMLLVQSKKSESGTLGIPLNHNSVVVFSLNTNQRFKHKIILDKSANPPENQWLGITFRTSKTFVQFQNGQPYFENGTSLTLADETQRREFYALRSRENKETNFTYPHITYTISESDLMSPKAE